ncbi:hypothetical protein C2S51_030277 [Perilla frutescens var. frutescens]|nr:hypothetical protein C2S51_030277 [Perilla frutescens var. frutescens]
MARRLYDEERDRAHIKENEGMLQRLNDFVKGIVKKLVPRSHSRSRSRGRHLARAPIEETPTSPPQSVHDREVEAECVQETRVEEAPNEEVMTNWDD